MSYIATVAPSDTAVNLEINAPRRGGLPVVGTHVRYRFWPHDEFRTGTVVAYWVTFTGSVNCDIKRDGYRETAVMPADKVVRGDLVIWV